MVACCAEVDSSAYSCYCARVACYSLECWSGYNAYSIYVVYPVFWEEWTKKMKKKLFSKKWEKTRKKFVKKLKK